MSADFSESVSVQDVWYAVKGYDYYRFRPSQLAVWLKSYHKKLGPEKFTSAAFLSQLLLPYYFLGNAPYFQLLTKAIVYKTADYISDGFPVPENRINFPQHIDLPDRVVREFLPNQRVHESF